MTIPTHDVTVSRMIRGFADPETERIWNEEISTGLRLDRYFGLSEGYWTGLQQDYELRQAKNQLRSVLDAIRPCTRAAA